MKLAAMGSKECSRVTSCVENGGCSLNKAAWCLWNITEYRNFFENLKFTNIVNFLCENRLFYKKYLQNVLYNVKQACILYLILLSIPTSFILSFKNSGWIFFTCWTKSVVREKSYLSRIPYYLSLIFSLTSCEILCWFSVFLSIFQGENKHWKPQKIAFSLRSYWTILWPLYLFSSIFKKFLW